MSVDVARARSDAASCVRRTISPAASCLADFARAGIGSARNKTARPARFTRNAPQAKTLTMGGLPCTSTRSTPPQKEARRVPPSVSAHAEDAAEAEERTNRRSVPSACVAFVSERGGCGILGVQLKDAGMIAGYHVLHVPMHGQGISVSRPFRSRRAMLATLPSLPLMPALESPERAVHSTKRRRSQASRTRRPSQDAFT